VRLPRQHLRRALSVTVGFLNEMSNWSIERKLAVELGR